LHRRRIVNASPLILLSKVGHLDLLQVEVDEVIVPDLVITEIRAYGATDLTVHAIKEATWLQLAHAPRVPAAIASWDLGDGESSVLALALGESGVKVVLDDLPARRRAAQLGLTVRGTLGIVVLARQHGVIPAARPVFEELRQCGMYLTDEFAERMLAIVGE
jgi:predicted nucleic acid-binding protein